jgi:tetratricopeptide (TPR) repeat protein
LPIFFLATAVLHAATGDQPAVAPEQKKAAADKKSPSLSDRVSGALQGAAAALNERTNELRREQVGLWTKYIQRHPDRSDGYQSRAKVYEELGEYGKAIADYTEAIRCDPKLREAYQKRAEAYEHNGEHDKAIADYTEVIRLPPDPDGPESINFTPAEAYFSRGEAYARKGDNDKAISDYAEAIRLGKNDRYVFVPKMFAERGRAYNNKGEYDRAIADCTETLRLDQEWVDAYYTRAIAYGKKSELDKVIADCTAGIRLDPRTRFRLAGILDLLRGEAYEAKGDDAKAEADYNKSVAELTAAIKDEDSSDPWLKSYYGKAKLETDLAEAKKKGGK